MNALKANASQFVFAVFLALGLSTGFSLGRPTARILPAPTAEPTLLTQVTGQRNVLVVGVDRLGSPQARLESLWLVMYTPDSRNFTLKPLYPSGAYRLAHNPFVVDPANPAGLDSLEVVADSEFWWSDYVLVDEIAMIELLDLLARPETDGKTASGALTIGSLPSPWNAPLEALESQTALLREICRKSPRLADLNSLDRLLLLTPDHLVTSIDRMELIAGWHRLAGDGFDIHCEFPSPD